MTVYVDDMRMLARVGRINARWSHLTADTPEELHKFAAQIGLKRVWFQKPKGINGKPVVPSSLKAQMWHYDVTDERRDLAIKSGAKPITMRESVEIMKRRHVHLFPPTDEQSLPFDL